MEVLRVPPYPLTTTWQLDNADYLYNVYVEDVVDHSSQTVEITSDSDGNVVYELPASELKLDRSFIIKFYDSDNVNVLHEDTLDIVRPYVDPKSMGDIASDIAKYKRYELIARSIIDTYSIDGFYNKKVAYEVQGNGADYIPLWRDCNKVLKVYENNVLVYDASTPDTNAFNFKISPDGTAIVKEFIGSNNNIVSAQAIVPIGRGDWVYDARNYGTFIKGFDYLFILDQGMRSLPGDIEEAARMLIDDIDCGRLDYYKRYIVNYNTDQFRIQFDKSMLDGTGNVIVDKIIDKYIKTIARPGVL